MFNDREQKLIRLALDPGAIGNEIQTSAVKVFESLRARGVIADVLLGFKPQARTNNFKTRFVFPNWGKHANESFEDIVTNDPSYFRWMFRKWFPNLDDEGKLEWQWLKNDIEEFLGAK